MQKPCSVEAARPTDEKHNVIISCNQLLIFPCCSFEAGLPAGDLSDDPGGAGEESDDTKPPLPPGEQFDSTALFHWCSPRPFEAVILVSVGYESYKSCFLLKLATRRFLLIIVKATRVVFSVTSKQSRGAETSEESCDSVCFC